MTGEIIFFATWTILHKLCSSLPTFELDIRFNGDVTSISVYHLTHGARPMRCAVVCARSAKCLGFFHSASLGVCLGTSDLNSVADTHLVGSKTGDGYTLYRKPACGEPSGYANATISDGNRIARQFTCTVPQFLKTVPEITCQVDPQSGLGSWTPAADICIEVYGSNCTLESDCEVINGTCIAGTCQCDPDKTYDTGLYKCKASFKLVPGEGGNGHNTGQLYLYFENTWSNVCLEYFTWTVTKAICKDINPSFVYGGTWHDKIVYGRGLDTSPSYKLKNLDCGTTGDVTSISDCIMEPIETSCDHNKDVGLTCYEYDVTVDSVRLNANHTKDGPLSEHRLEVYYNGTWGTVCEHGWSGSESDISCLSMDPSKPRKDGECKDSCAGGPAGPYMTSDVKCDGDEPHIFFCQNYGWTTGHECPGKEVGLICKV